MSFIRPNKQIKIQYEIYVHTSRSYLIIIYLFFVANCIFDYKNLFLINMYYYFPFLMRDCITNLLLPTTPQI